MRETNCKLILSPIDTTSKTNRLNLNTRKHNYPELDAECVGIVSTCVLDDVIFILKVNLVSQLLKSITTLQVI